MKGLSEKQKAARKLASDYLGFLVDQEIMVDRLIARKWEEMEPQLEQMIDRKIRERLVEGGRQ